MKAVRFHDYAAPPRIEEVAEPTPGPGEILVRVQAAALNPLDIKLHSGSRKWFFPLELPYVMGSDLAGTVEKIGPGVETWRVGNRVVGRCPPLRGGAFAELAVVSALHCAPLPAALSMVEGAAIPTAAGTARRALFDVAGLSSGQRVLIHAGAGGVGSFAVQYARRCGAEVFATASRNGVGLVRGLGAHRVIDYLKEDFTAIALGMDVVLDTVGNDTLDRSFLSLKPGGFLVSVVMPPDEEKARARGVSAHRLFYSLEDGELPAMVSEIACQTFRVQIDRTLPLASFAEAFDRQASGRAHGKIVLTDF